MATILAKAVSNETGSGTTITASLNNGGAGITGTDVAIVVGISARTVNTAFSVNSCTYDGSGMTLVRDEQGNLNGFPSGMAHIRVLPIGNPSGLIADVVATLSASNAGRDLTAWAVEGIDQTTPLRAQDGTFTITAASSTSRNLTSQADDFLMDVLVCAAEQTVTPGGSQTQDFNQTGTNPATYTHASSHHDSPNAGNTTMSQSWSNSSFAYAAASFRDSGFVPGGSPTITSVTGSKGAGGIIPVTDTNIALAGTLLLGTVSTKLYYSSSSTFNAEIMVEQEIDSVTANSLNWKFPSLGDIGRGTFSLFVVTNEGEIDEEISAAFAIQVEAFVTTGTPTLARFVYVTTGSESGPTTVVSGMTETPKAAVIAAISTPNLDSVDADSPSTLCIVAGNGTMGDGIAAKTAGGTVLRRKQASGTGSLILMSSASTSATDLVTGTPSLTSDGMSINFTNTSAGRRLYISFLVGDDVTAEVREIQISDGSVTGLPFAPELAIGTCVGLGLGSSGDNTFSLRSWGVANATDQCLLGLTNDTSRNCTAKSGSFLGQISSTAFDWEMSITSFTADGITWTGSNADSAFILFVNLNGRGTFVGQFATTASGANGVEEDLPDLGFDPELIVIQTALRTSESLATALGGRFSLGSCTEILDNRCTTTKFLPATGTGTAEQFQSEGLIFAGDQASGGPQAFTGKIVSFGQVSTIQYPAKDPASILLHILAIEKGVGEVIATDADGGNVTTISEGDE